VVVLLLLLGVGLREKNLASLCCLSYRILRRDERINFFAIVIHFANKFTFNSENSVISFANHLACSNGMSLAYC